MGEVGEVVAVLDVERAVPRSIQLGPAYEDGRPYLLDGVEAALLLVVGPQYAVGAQVALGVEGVPAVVAYDALVGQVPQELPGIELPLAQRLPVVLDACPVTAVVQAVQALRGHVDMVTLRDGLQRVGIAGIVPGVHAVQFAPGLQHLAVLGIPDGIVAPHLGVEAALVAVVPEEDAGVVHVAPYHLAYEASGRGRVVLALPAGQLVEHVEAQRVAVVQEVAVGRIVAHAHGVHVHLLYQSHVLQGYCRTDGASRLGPDGVAVHALQEHLHAVHVEAVALPYLDGAEAEALAVFVQGAPAALQAEDGLVEVGCLGRPLQGVRQLSGQRDGAVGTDAPCRNRLTHAPAVGRLYLGLYAHVAFRLLGQVGEGQHPEAAVVARIDGHPLDEVAGLYLQVDGTEDAAEDPVVGTPLGLVHARVGRLLVHQHVQLVLAAQLQQVGHLVLEAVEGALVRGACRLSVQAHRGVYLGGGAAHVLSVTVAVHGTQHGYTGKPLHNLVRAYVAGMPYLVTSVKECGVTVIPVAVGIGQDPNLFHIPKRSLASATIICAHFS